MLSEVLVETERIRLAFITGGRDGPTLAQSSPQVRHVAAIRRGQPRRTLRNIVLLRDFSRERPAPSAASFVLANLGQGVREAIGRNELGETEGLGAVASEEEHHR